MYYYYLQNLANFITISRIVIIPFIILTFYFKNKILGNQIATILFIVASLSDMFDGMIARKYKAISKIGTILDPIADKILISSSLIILIYFKNINFIPCMLIIVREISVSGLREILSYQQNVINVSKLSKIKTITQMLAITLLIFGSEGSGIFFVDKIGIALLWFAAFLTIITAYPYFKKAFDKLN